MALLLSLGVVAAGAQTVNPRTVSFAPSPDHDGVGADGRPLVTGYDLEFYSLGGSQPLVLLNLGKPLPGSDGNISVDFASMLAAPPAPGQQLEARVAAVGPDGKGESAPSNTFVFDCTAAVSPTSLSGPSQGGSGSVSVTVLSGCTWQAASAAPWIVITSGAGGNGSGTVAFTTTANPATTPRVGTMTVAGQTVTVAQAAAAAANAAPSVQVTSPASGATFTAPATMTISAAASDSDGTVTGVAIRVNGLLIGSTASAPCTVTWTNVAPGSYAITAAATDNTGATTTSTAVVVTVKAPNVAPSVQLTSPGNGATFNAPASIALAASAADSDGTISRVSFYANGALVGMASASPYSILWTNVAAGAYTLAAVAVDNSGAQVTSASVTVTVATAATNAPPSVQVTSPGGNAILTAPVNVAITATASDRDGTVVRVDFYVNATLVGSASGSPCTVRWSTGSSGNYTIKAIATDNAGLQASSAPMTVTVRKKNGKR